MSESLSGSPNFFGKDGFTPFVGQVEDVDDPTLSGRVKVRCVGWHPKEKKGGSGGDALPTDDLPWARVGMPVTHAQQSRIGGKHGLLPGSWVFGFFLDGNEAQDPFVISSFNHTAKSVEEDYRKDVAGDTGKLTDDAPGFTPVQVAPKDSPNVARQLPGEQQQKKASSPVDPGAAMGSLLDSKDNKCGSDPKSVANIIKEGEKKTDTPSGQNYGVNAADGLCGKVRHASDDIGKIIKEQMPPEISRFTYGDQVWSDLTGNHINLNGAMAQMAQQMAGILKQTVNASKSMQEEQLYRKTKASSILAVPDRDGLARVAVDEATTVASDLFNVGIQSSIINQLPQLITSLLQQQNNSEESDRTDNKTAFGEAGANANTQIQNSKAKCLAEDVVVNVNALLQQAFEEGIANSEAVTKQIESEQSGGGSSDTLSQLSQASETVASLIGSGNPLAFVIDQFFGMFPGLFHAGGLGTMDLSTIAGCATERIYNTGSGSQGSAMAGLSGQGGSFSGGAGSNSDRNTTESNALTGFGGVAKAKEKTVKDANMIPCEDATTLQVPDDYNLPAAINTVPAGKFGAVEALPLPSENINAAENFVQGIPNVIVITNPGEQYFYRNLTDKKKVYPSIFIPGYAGTPVPVVDTKSGELVAIQTTPLSWDINQPNAPVSIIPDNNEVGIISCGGNYDVILSGFFVRNTGRGYVDPQITIYDRDKEEVNGKAKLIIQDGRVVDVQIIDNGRGFCRIPTITITDIDGYGAKVYPIMNAIPREETTKNDPVQQEYIFCPSEAQKNAIREIEQAAAMVTAANKALLTTILGGPTIDSDDLPPSTPELPMSPTPTPPPNIIVGPQQQSSY